MPALITHNRLVTQGFGATNGTPGRAWLVCRGMSGPPSVIIEKITSVVRRHGGHSTREQLRDLQVVMVWAKLVEVNDRRPDVAVSGRARVDEATKQRSSRARLMVDLVSVRTKSLIDTIKVTAKRLR